MASTTYSNKVKHIVPAFLMTVVATVVGLGFFRWLLGIHYSIIDIKEEYWEIWIPFIFPVFPLFFGLKKRFKAFSINGDFKNSLIALMLISWTTMSGMLYFSQTFLSTATAKLQTLSSIVEIDKYPQSRYYSLKNITVANQYFGGYTSTSIVGQKNNRWYIHNVYLVSPIVNDTSELMKDAAKYWCGVKFTDKIPITFSGQFLTDRYDQFYNQCIEKMKNYDFSNVNYFERTPTSSVKTAYLFAIENQLQRKTDDTFVILEPKIDNYNERNGNNFYWSLASFGIGFFLFLFALTKVDFVDKK